MMKFPVYGKIQVMFQTTNQNHIHPNMEELVEDGQDQPALDTVVYRWVCHAMKLDSDLCTSNLVG